MTSFEHYLYGTAVSNHATYLHDLWDRGLEPASLASAYLAGMVEHALYAAYKVVLITEFIFVDIGLAAHYLFCRLRSDEEAQNASETHLFVGLLILSESILGLGVDAIGVVCPPLAYKVHEWLKQAVTQRCFERLGLIGYDMKKEEFVVGAFWYESCASEGDGED